MTAFKERKLIINTHCRFSINKTTIIDYCICANIGINNVVWLFYSIRFYFFRDFSMNISGIVQKTSENIKKKRKLKRLKKNINEILLLSGKDPSDDFHIDELPPEPNSSKG